MLSSGFLNGKVSILRQIANISTFSGAKTQAPFQQRHNFEAIESYSKQPLNTSNFTFPSLLKACVSLSKLCYGRILHCTIVKLGLHFDPYITTSLVNMYIKCGSLYNAVKVFENGSKCEYVCRDVTLWNSMIDGFFKNEFIEEGVSVFRRMQLLDVKPDGFTLSILLGVCNGSFGVLVGKEIHGFVVRNIFEEDPFVITALVDMYSNFHRPRDAWHLFDSVKVKNNMAIWNAMIKGFSENRFWKESLELYILVRREGFDLGSMTFSSVLTACSLGGEVDFGIQIHCDVVKKGFESDGYVLTSLLTLYGKCHLIKDAEKIFESKVDKGVETWNGMISAYLYSDCVYEALDMYHEMRFRMVLTDSFTLSNILAACSIIRLYDFGRIIHGEVNKRPLRNNITLQSVLLTMYSKCGQLEDAFSVFNEMKGKDAIAWTSMISGYFEKGKFDEALVLFKKMGSAYVKPDPNLLTITINACAALRGITLGCCIHGLAVKNGLELDAFVGSSLINFYSKCGLVEMAENVFSDTLDKNLVVWNSLISCFCQNGLPDRAISLLPEILKNGLYPDAVSITNVLTAVSSLASLLKGKAVHGYYIRQQIREETQVLNALIDTYIKCGCLRYAECIFQNMAGKNLITWNSMITGYGSHGECVNAINLFEKMRNSGVPPDGITFLSLISSCNHSGLVDEGMDLFQMMKECSIEPKMEHYMNMVDLLGRAGHLDDAYRFIQEMPIEPEQSVWLCLLSACRVHRNVELGELAAHKLLEMDPTRGSNYTQLLNLYVEAELQEKAANLRALMRQKGLKKVPGCSWIEVQNKVDIFFSGDCSSPRTIEIYETLESLRAYMKRRKYCEEAQELVGIMHLKN